MDAITLSDMLALPDISSVDWDPEGQTVWVEEDDD